MSLVEDKIAELEDVVADAKAIAKSLENLAASVTAAIEKIKADTAAIAGAPNA